MLPVSHLKCLGDQGFLCWCLLSMWEVRWYPNEQHKNFRILEVAKAKIKVDPMHTCSEYGGAMFF